MLLIHNVPSSESGSSSQSGFDCHAKGLGCTHDCGSIECHGSLTLVGETPGKSEPAKRPVGGVVYKVFLHTRLGCGRAGQGLSVLISPDEKELRT